MRVNLKAAIATRQIGKQKPHIAGHMDSSFHQISDLGSGLFPHFRYRSTTMNAKL